MEYKTRLDSLQSTKARAQTLIEERNLKLKLLKALGNKIFSTKDGKEFVKLTEKLFHETLNINMSNFLEKKEQLSFILGARYIYDNVLFGNYPDNIKLLIINKELSND
jgi:hypothetical protein